MPFKKGEIPKGANIWKKGQSGNPNGQPRKLATQLKMIGYTKAEASHTINAMLAMTIDELKEIFENPNSTILEKTIANALKKSLEKGSLYSIDTLLNRTHGKPTEMLEVNAETKSQIIVNFGSTNQLQSAQSTDDSSE